MEARKVEFQLEFTNLSGRTGEEITTITAQMTPELLQVRNELEQTRLQIDTLNNSQAARSPSHTI